MPPYAVLLETLLIMELEPNRGSWLVEASTVSLPCWPYYHPMDE